MDFENYPIQIEIENLVLDKLFSYFGTCSIWNHNTSIAIIFGDIENKQELLIDYLPLLEKYLGWLNQYKKNIVQALIDDNYLKGANQWTAWAKKEEDQEKECYIIKGQKIFLPITEEDFANSLYLDWISFDCAEGKNKITMELFLTCSPDYFSGHTIIVFIAQDRTITEIVFSD